MPEWFLISQRFSLSFMQLNAAAVFVYLSVTVYLSVCVRAAHELENIEIAIQPRNGFLKHQRRGDVQYMEKIQKKPAPLVCAWHCPCVCVLLQHLSSPHTIFKQSGLLYLEGSVVKSINTTTFEQMLSLYLVLAVHTHLSMLKVTTVRTTVAVQRMRLAIFCNKYCVCV